MLQKLTAAEVKAEAKKLGADLVGISAMSRFEGCPPQNDARHIFPGAKSMIVLGFRIPRGSLRGIEEGTLFNNYPTMGYAALNQIYGPMVLWNLNRFLEDHGYENVPMLNMNGGETINPVTGKFRKGWSRPVRPGMPYPDILVNFRFAAYMAGLGEIGWSKLLLTPEFGPRVRFALMLTDAELDPDPIYEGRICDRCKLCAKNCSGKAIGMTESVKTTIAGHEVEWAKLDELACEVGLQGGADGALNPFDQEYPRKYGYGRAIEGACGCTRACMVHLEERKRITNEFFNTFREKGWTQWKIDRSKPYEYNDEIYKWYEERGMVEEWDTYVNYNKTQNYGTEKNPDNTVGSTHGDLNAAGKAEKKGYDLLND